VLRLCQRGPVHFGAPSDDACRRRALTVSEPSVRRSTLRLMDPRRNGDWSPRRDDRKVQVSVVVVKTNQCSGSPVASDCLGRFRGAVGSRPDRTEAPPPSIRFPRTLGAVGGFAARRLLPWLAIIEQRQHARELTRRSKHSSILPATCSAVMRAHRYMVRADDGEPNVRQLEPGDNSGCGSLTPCERHEPRVDQAGRGGTGCSLLRRTKALPPVAAPCQHFRAAPVHTHCDLVPASGAGNLRAEGQQVPILKFLDDLNELLGQIVFFRL